MSVVHPFQALIPPKYRAAEVAAVPYDVVNRSEARELAKGNPWSFLHISRPEIDLDIKISPFSNEAYRQASLNFNRIIKECPLVRDENPSLYIYRLKQNNHEQTGIVGCFSIDEYESNLIKKHEHTRRDKEDDRTRHLLELGAQTGPVFLAYSDVSEINCQVRLITQTSPLYDFVALDQVIHTIWRVQQPEIFVKLFSDQVQNLYIADGHHRAAAACRGRAELMKMNKLHCGNEDYNYFLAGAFPSSQLRILPYHRLIKDLGGLKVDQLLDRIRRSYDLLPGNRPVPKAREFGMYLLGQWTLLRPKMEVPPHTLDVDLLQQTLLEPVLKINDPRSDSRIEFVGGNRSILELEKRVASGEAAIAFLVHPTRMEDLMKISGQGKVMPPKSTWFEPKLRDGLFCNYFEKIESF